MDLVRGFGFWLLNLRASDLQCAAILKALLLTLRPAKLSGRYAEH